MGLIAAIAPAIPTVSPTHLALSIRYWAVDVGYKFRQETVQSIVDKPVDVSVVSVEYLSYVADRMALIVA